MPELSYTYFPGCSQRGISKGSDLSARAVSQALGIELTELPDWSCCGAISAHSLSRPLAIALPVRNLTLAEEYGRDVAVVCTACFQKFRIAQHEMVTDAATRQEIEEVVGAAYQGRVKVRHLCDIIANDIGLARLKEMVKQPLTGLKPVVYYGCCMIRPAKVLQFDDPENPQILDQLMAALGAEPVPWSYKADCCGGSLSITRPDVCARLVGVLLSAASDAGANCVVTPCPLCLTNMDMRQREAAELMPWNGPIPIFYFTELMGVALGMPESISWADGHLVSGRPLLEQVHLGPGTRGGK